MKDLIQIQQKLVPDLLDEMKSRYRILQQIQLTQPIGRRTLAQNLGTTERILRAEVEFLKNQALISAETVGMSVTEAGRQILNQLELVMRELEGFRELEEKLSRALGIPKVYIVPGDSEKNSLVKREMGYLTARIIKENLREGVLAITGGSTMATVAEMTPQSPSPFSVEVLPARGGMGGNVENQANTIAAALANKLGGSYWMLHVPDNLSEDAYHMLHEEPHVREYLNRIKKVRMVVHGIGQAITMAKRRGTSDEILSLLLREEAIGEALGFYFAQDGRVVFAMKNSIGLQTNDLQGVEHIIAVAGGADKANAAVAAARGSRQDVLVTDQVCAEAILASII
jgi:central glycolytic genes regulator